MRNRTKIESELENKLNQYFYSKEKLEDAIKEIILLIDYGTSSSYISLKIKNICHKALKE